MSNTSHLVFCPSRGGTRPPRPAGGAVGVPTPRGRLRKLRRISCGVSHHAPSRIGADQPRDACIRVAAAFESSTGAPVATATTSSIESRSPTRTVMAGGGYAVPCLVSRFSRLLEFDVVRSESEGGSMRPLTRPALSIALVLGVIGSSGMAWAAPATRQSKVQSCSGMWTIQSSPSPGDSDFLFGVAALSSTDAWAVGIYYSTGYGGSDYTLAEHYSG